MAQITAKELAARFGTDPRTMRKFLRSDITAQGGKVGEDTPGKGGRYAIEAKSVKSLQKRFDAWIAAKAPKGDDAPESDNEVEAPITD